VSRSLLLGGAQVAAPPTVSIAGQVTIGGTLTATEGGSVTSRKWQRGDAWGQSGIGTYSDIGGATGTTYSPTSADIGYAIRCVTTGPGGTTNSNVLHYTYATVAAVIDVLEQSALAPGAVGALTGSKAGFALTQSVAGQKPIASQSSFNSKPGLQFQGPGFNSVLAGVCDFSPYNSLRIVAALTDGQTAAAMILELTADATSNNGGFLIDVNDSNPSVGVFARGSAGFGACTAVESLASPCVMSFGVTTTLTKGCVFIRKNGTPLSLSTAVNSCGPGNFANAQLNYGARNGGLASPWAGTSGPALMFLSGQAQDGDLADAEAYLKNGAGL